MKIQYLHFEDTELGQGSSRFKTGVTIQNDAYLLSYASLGASEH
jgi:hypothetical protein